MSLELRPSASTASIATMEYGDGGLLKGHLLWSQTKGGQVIAP